MLTLCSIVDDLPTPDPGKTGWPWNIGMSSALETVPNFGMLPRISIITPSFNQGQYIEETIRSVVLQGYPNLEYIIIDGGSSDQSVEIIKKYSSHLTFWTSEKDRGQSDAINKGLKRATGEIYGWINSDDCLARDTLWEVAKAYRACKDKQRFWVVFAIECIDERAGKRNLMLQKPANDLNDWLVDDAQVNQQGAFWSASITKEIGYLDETLHLGLDTEYFMRMVARGYSMTCLERVGAMFRIHENCKSANFFGPVVESNRSFGYDWAVAKLSHLPRDHPQYKSLRRELNDRRIHFLIRFAQNKQLRARERLAYLARAAFVQPRTISRKDFLSTLRHIVLEETRA